MVIGIVLGASIPGTTGIMAGVIIAGMPGTDHGVGTIGIVGTVARIMVGEIIYTMVMYFMETTGTETIGITMAGTIGIMDTITAIKRMAVEKVDRLPLQ